MTDPNLESQEQENGGPTHIEVEPPALESDAPPPAAPAAGGPPRAFPQHYRLLFGAVCVFFGAMTVWERAHVFGAEIEGEAMISGTILMILSGYSILVGVLNILQGRLAGMLAAFMTGVLALYFGIPAMFGTYRHDGFITLGEIQEYIDTKEAEQTIPERFVSNPDVTFPKATFDKFTTKQDAWKYVIGQYAPGPLMTTFGGGLLIWVFLGAMFGGKKGKSEPEPQTSRVRRGRR